ncbi:exocyst complex component 8 [Anthonomus grandis grandis]|uniref:exocyst complex component 8 n=1 Tax=Anthonomus grandis grandis TaxID=2921223 RepID=UPI002164F6E5|nr:exocyst complex component 8 [Anthonomus grandis grandis]
MDISKEPNFQLLSSPSFVPEKYIKEISQNYVGGSELQNLKKKIQQLSDETSNNLKKNVYQNYVQFIDTAKEISHLESEMYQLSHLLSEQKFLLNTLSTTSILEDRTHFNIERNNKLEEQDIEEENRQKLTTILEKVEGCKEVIEAPGRVFIFEGDLLEIDSTENTAIKFVHVYLFNDTLMITNRNSNSRGLMRYAFESLYELSSLAVVNVRDLGNIKHAFKLLIFPDTRVFQCSSNASKKDWLDKIDQAKKTRLAVEQQQKRESSIEKSSPARSVSIDLSSQSKNEEITITHPDWFHDIPDELDVCLAQRQFEDAVNYLNRAQHYINKFNSQHSTADHTVLDIQKKVELKQSNLIDMLMKELEVNPEKSLQGGLRATRTAVRLLNQLGRSTQSCDLFLKLCSSMLKTQCKRVKREGSTTTYVRHLSSVVFTNMCHMSEEFLRAFPDSSDCASAYVVWASGELNQFTTHFAKQVFMPQTSLSTITECVELVRFQCERLCTYGVDFRYQVDGALRTPLTKALSDARDKFIDSIKLRAIDDKWIPMNLVTRSGLARCLQEHSNMGLKLDSYVTGDVWLQLTSSNLAFTKAFLTLLDDCLKLKTTELLHPINETLQRVFDAQIRSNEQALRNELQPEQKQFILKNIEFLLQVLMDLTQKKYKETVGFECEHLNKLVNEHSALLKRNTKTKYSSEFL